MLFVLFEPYLIKKIQSFKISNKLFGFLSEDRIFAAAKVSRTAH